MSSVSQSRHHTYQTPNLRDSLEPRIMVSWHIRNYILCVAQSEACAVRSLYTVFTFGVESRGSSTPVLVTCQAKDQRHDHGSACVLPAGNHPTEKWLVESILKICPFEEICVEMTSNRHCFDHSFLTGHGVIVFRLSFIDIVAKVESLKVGSNRRDLSVPR